MSTSDAALYLLQRRGFIIEPCGNDVFQLVKPYAQDDIIYLREILTSANAGEIDCSGKFVIKEASDLQAIRALFTQTDEKKGVGECQINHKWSDVISKQYGHVDDIPVRWLDPYIAYYVRVLAFCGIFTAGCCDGNHINPRRQTLNIIFDSPIYALLHQWMWETRGFSFNIPWKWSRNKASIKISESNHVDIYYNLFVAAQDFYEERDYYIRARQKAAQKIPLDEAERLMPEELANRFLAELMLLTHGNTHT